VVNNGRAKSIPAPAASCPSDQRFAYSLAQPNEKRPRRAALLQPLHNELPAQFLITGLLGPHSNARGPNEFLHVPYAKKLTACVASVIAAHGATR
jgi:hypothetical protein